MTMLDRIAHEITAVNTATCCHKSGGMGGPLARPGCECRESAAAILAMLQSDEAVERVAMAIHDASTDDDDGDWAIAYARAAIRALLEDGA